MKGLITTLLFVFIGIQTYSQSPEKFSFQSVVRDAQNNIVSNVNVGVRMSILQGSATGTIVYMETHNAVTNQNGLFTIEVGNGVVQNGNFSNINWGSGTYYSKTEIDPLGGTNYSITGISQMLSVPYALYAKNSGNLLNQWSHGSTAPQVNQGTVGDYYFNSQTGDVYQKNSTSTWTLISNLMGGQGNPGLSGINCWDINQNHINDPNEDMNNDGLFSPLDCIGQQGNTGSNGFNCWDLNQNQINDPAEDTNNDGLFSSLDCIGAQGPQGNPGPINSGAPIFINPQLVYQILVQNGYNSSTISVDFDTIFGQNVSTVILYFESICTTGSSYNPSSCSVNALSNGINFEIIENYHGVSGNTYPYGSDSGQIILPVGANGIITFSNVVSRSDLRVKIIGYYP
jgi:hypothetical protein